MGFYLLVCVIVALAHFFKVRFKTFENDVQKEDAKLIYEIATALSIMSFMAFSPVDKIEALVDSTSILSIMCFLGALFHTRKDNARFLTWYYRFLIFSLASFLVGLPGYTDMDPLSHIGVASLFISCGLTILIYVVSFFKKSIAKHFFRMAAFFLGVSLLALTVSMELDLFGLFIWLATFITILIIPFWKTYRVRLDQ